MWENVIGVVSEQTGSNSGVEALIHAPSHGGGRKAAAERRAAAHTAVLATGGFDTAITNYQSLLNLAKSQGAVGGGADRGACRICGHVGHLTKQCRNGLAASETATGGEGPGPSRELAQESEESDLALSASGSDSDAGRRRSGGSKRHRSDKKRKHKSRVRCGWGGPGLAQRDTRRARPHCGTCAAPVPPSPPSHPAAEITQEVQEAQEEVARLLLF